MGKGDNRLTPLVKKRAAQRKKKLKLKKILELAAENKKRTVKFSANKVASKSSSSLVKLKK